MTHMSHNVFAAVLSGSCLACIMQAQECRPLTSVLIERIQSYVTIQNRIPGGVVADTERARKFPANTCILRIPLRAKDPAIPYHETVIVSEDRRYFGPLLFDLSLDPLDVAMDKFHDCHNSERPRKMLALDDDFIAANGLSASPTIFVNDFKVEGLPRSEELMSMITLMAKEQRAVRTRQ
jgi:hypothetical protein